MSDAIPISSDKLDEILAQRLADAKRIRALEAENERLVSLVCQWSENCTGRHGSQSQCVESVTPETR